MASNIRGRDLKLLDLVDLETLQQIQDRFADVVGVSTAIRDRDGTPITEISRRAPLCDMVRANPELHERCRQSHLAAIRESVATGQARQYECHAGLVQIATPIVVEGHLLGTIIMGDRPKPDGVIPNRQELMDKLGLTAESLDRHIAAMSPWSDEHMHRAAELIHSIANAIALACYRQAELMKVVDELGTLYEISRMMAAKGGLQELLDTITQAVVRVLGMKACSLRLLDESGEELKISSVCNLSSAYLDKGPVLVSQNPIDDQALRGEVVVIEDMRTDPRTFYRREAVAEGLASGLVVGLRSGDRPLGTLHMYTAEPRDFTTDEQQLAVAVANQAAASIENVQLEAQRRQKARMDRELRVAARIQTGLLPEHVPEHPRFQLAVHYRPCYALGGDYYDFIPFQNDNVGIAIGDVSGKSLPAAILMASARAALRAHTESLFEIGSIVARLNRALYQDMQEEHFITLFYGVLDPDGGQLTYTNAGHLSPVLIRDGAATRLRRGGLALGFRQDASYEQGILRLTSGDVVLFLTDGISEAGAPDRPMYGEARLIETARAHVEQDAAEILAALRQSIDEFTGYAQPDDDRTLLVLKMT